VHSIYCSGQVELESLDTSSGRKEGRNEVPLVALMMFIVMPKAGTFWVGPHLLQEGRINRSGPEGST
jgi:hypothetical protein